MATVGLTGDEKGDMALCCGDVLSELAEVEVVADR